MWRLEAEIERELHCCKRTTEAKGELPNDAEDHEGGQAMEIA